MSTDSDKHNRKVEELRMFVLDMLETAIKEFHAGKYLASKMRMQMADQAIGGLRRLSGDTE